MVRERSEVLDEWLVLRCQSGDARAVELLVRAWHPRLLRRAASLTGRPEVAADVAQEAWMAIVRGLGRLKDPAQFRGWAYRIVANKARDWIRREQARRRAADRLEEFGAETSGPAEASDDGRAAARMAEMAKLRAALAGLPRDRRTILAWFYLEERSVREIAEVLGIPEGTVKSRLYHARAALRASIEEEP